MPGPKYVTARRDENVIGTGALLGRQEKPTYFEVPARRGE